MDAQRRRRTAGPIHAAPELISLLRSAGTPDYLGELIDCIAGFAAHDRVTVTRYSTQKQPEFLTHRNFNDELVRRYLEVYYPYDPFYGFWCAKERPGIVPLRQFSSRELKQGLYIAEFLHQSAIRDEVGVLLDDGSHATLAVFLERSDRNFRQYDIAVLERAYPLLQAVHEVHRRLLAPASSQHPASREPPRRATSSNGKLPAELWPELTAREREITAMILAGHPSSAIANRLRISSGTVRIHRHNIYAKLDITAEREVFLQYLDYVSQNP
ncbi:MAG: helix-turn-helix transcriptional regulator [Pseudomonadota bacterium]|nr:helix-turn-helix transcriptional regulator [Pseudomonadota bacterium]